MALADVLKAAEPQYKRGPAAGPGAPQQMPYGQATALNEASAGVPTAPIGPSPEAMGGQAPPPNMQDMLAMAPPFNPQNDEEKFLYGPSQNPQEGLMAGAGYLQRVPPSSISEDVYAALPYLRRAAQMTGDPRLDALHRMLIYQIGQEG